MIENLFLCDSNIDASHLLLSDGTTWLAVNHFLQSSMVIYIQL